MNASLDCKGPLDGIRVIDLSRILAGPTATQLLGDFGADIIKIERPGRGDDTRAWGPPYVTGGDGEESTESAYYLSANRNKKSVAVDISTTNGQQTIRRLVATADVLIENFKPGGLKKYGLSYDDLKTAFPQLVYCSISGFGQTGPNAHKPGYDILAQGYGGIMSQTGMPDSEPTRVGVGIADVMTGMYASNAILAALRHKEQSGEGQHIDVALVDCQIAWLVNAGTNYLMSGKDQPRLGNQHPNIVPYQVFAVSDGHVIVAVGNDEQYQRFCELIEHPDLATDERFVTNRSRLEHRDTLVDILADILSQWSREDLIQGMETLKIPVGPIHSVSEVFATDQVAARDMRISMPHELAKSGSVDLIGNPVKFSKTPVTYRHTPPQCGADTDEILSSLEPPNGTD